MNDAGERPMVPAVPQPVVGEVDGVRVVTLARPDQITSARLVFASGWADERPWQRHGLHLLEHLVVSELRGLAAEMDGSVDMHTTEFEVSGQPEVVRHFLEQVCRLLVDPPLARAEVEARVLAVEGGLGGDIGPVEAIAHARYGHTGCGVLALPEPDPASLTRSTLLELAHRCFRRDLAQLLLIGAPVPDIRLPLRDGPAADRGWRTHRPVAEPTVVLGEVPRLGVSFVHSGDEPATAYICEVALEQRVSEELRHRLGWTYDIDTIPCLGAGEVCRILHLDVDEDHTEDAGDVFRDVVTAFLEHGPTDEEVRHAVQVIEVRSLLPLSRAEYTIGAGVAARTGFPPAARGMDALLTITPEHVRRWLSSVRGSTLWYAPEWEEHHWRKAGWAVYEAAGPPSAPPPGARTVRPSRLSRLLGRDARSAQLVIGPDSVTAHLRDGTVHIPDQDVVAVITSLTGKGRFLVAGRDGSTIELGDAVYPGSDTVLDRIRTTIGPHVFYKSGPLSDG